MRRVVVTGMGIVSSIGANAQEVVASLHDGKSGITRAERQVELGFRSQVHGAPTLRAEDVVDRRAMRFHGGGTAWNHVAMDQAIRDSGLEQTDIVNPRTGIIMGSGGPSTRTLVEAAAARFAVRYPERTLETEFPADLPTLEADPVVRRVFDNLLDNARKYSEAPVELSARKSSDGAHFVVAVKDRGIGISEQDQPRIFEPFFRSDPSRTRATGGVGLGLAVVRRIVEAHQGTIEVQSDLGQGTRFVVTLPLTQVASAAASAPPS